MASPFFSSGIGALDGHGFMDRLAGAWQQTWDDLHVSPRTAPSKGAKLCTYHHWFGRPSKVYREPYYELPMSVTRLWALVQLNLTSHSLPVEQGKFVGPQPPAPSPSVQPLQHSSCWKEGRKVYNTPGSQLG